MDEWAHPKHGKSYWFDWIAARLPTLSHSWIQNLMQTKKNTQRGGNNLILTALKWDSNCLCVYACACVRARDCKRVVRRQVNKHRRWESKQERKKNKAELERWTKQKGTGANREKGGRVDKPNAENREKQGGGWSDGEQRGQVSLMAHLSALLDHQLSLAAAVKPHAHTHTQTCRHTSCLSTSSFPYLSLPLPFPFLRPEPKLQGLLPFKVWNQMYFFVRYSRYLLSKSLVMCSPMINIIRN